MLVIQICKKFSCAQYGHYLIPLPIELSCWAIDSDTNFAVTSTSDTTLWNSILVGPITPRLPTTFPLTIQGDGSAHRKFIYVEDLADGNVAALSSEGKNQVINLEGPRNISVKEVAETVNILFDGKVEINYVEARPGDYAGKIVSNDKSKELLNWEPQVDFKEGAFKFLEWYKKNIQ